MNNRSHSLRRDSVSLRRSAPRTGIIALLINRALPLSVAVLLCGAAIAQDEDEREEELRDAGRAEEARRVASDEVLDEVVVRGIRSSIESALMTKRSADNIVDAISAEGIGRFPDLNLAESLQRITGVQIVRDDTRNGQVAIRGIRGFSKTQFNGQDLASPNHGGSFLYGIFESSVLSGVEVQKTPTVKMDAGGIAGIVNLRTRRALDFDEPFHLFVTGKAQYEELNGAVIPDIGLAAGFQNSDETLGAYVSMGYQERDFRSDSARVTEYKAFDPAGVELSRSDLQSDPGVVASATFVPFRSRYTSRGTTGDRYSIAGGVEWRPVDDLSLNLTGIFADSSSRQPLNQITVMTFGTRVFDYTVLGSIDNGSAGTTATSVMINSPQMQVQERIRDQDYQTWATTLDADWTRGPWTLHGALHYTEGETTQSQFQITSRIENRRSDDRSFVDNGLVAAVNLGGSGRHGFAINVTPSPADINTFGFGTTNGPDTGDHLFAGIFASGTNNYVRVEDQFAAQIDLTREVDWPFFSSIDFGAKFKSLGQDNREKRFSNSFNGNNLDLSVWDNSLFGSGFINDGDGFLGGDLAFQGFLLPNALTALAALPPADPSALTSEQAIDPRTGLIFGTEGGGKFDHTQDIISAYASINFDRELGPITMRGNAGLRYVDTSREARTRSLTRVNGVDERVDIKATTDFDDFLPQINLIFDFTDNLVGRVSYSETLSRPDPNSVRAGNVVTATFDNTTGELTRISQFSDRSQLKPFTAESYDVALEWYNREGSVVHGALFTKEITNFIVIQPNCPATILGVEDLIVGTPAFDANGVCLDDAGTVISAALRVNTPESFEISGFELGVTQNFDFLDGFWSNLGATLNYTYLDVKDETSDGNNANLLSLSPHSYNLIGYYETDRLGVRLAGNFRSNFVDGNAFGGFLGADRIVDDRLQWDLSVSYNVTDKFRLGFEAINLTDEGRYEYQGVKSRFRNFSKEGRTLTVSASMEF